MKDKPNCNCQFGLFLVPVLICHKENQFSVCCIFNGVGSCGPSQNVRFQKGKNVNLNIVRSNVQMPFGILVMQVNFHVNYKITKKFVVSTTRFSLSSYKKEDRVLRVLHDLFHHYALLST